MPHSPQKLHLSGFTVSTLIVPPFKLTAHGSQNSLCRQGYLPGVLMFYDFVIGQLL
jgi:hypothetical protein